MAYRKNNYKFINPYNFIPLGAVPVRYEASKGSKTGVIHCTLTTRTPLIMIDSDPVKKEKNRIELKKDKYHYQYLDTYALGEKHDIPAIPGSELRGMIRSDFEALTNSCMASMEEEMEFFGRYAPANQDEALNRPGLVEFGEDGKSATLYKCKKYFVINPFSPSKDFLKDGDAKDLYFKVKNAINNPKNKFTSGTKVYFKTKEVEKRKNNKTTYVDRVVEITTIKGKNGCNKEGILKIGEKLGNNVAYHVFEKLAPLTSKDGIDNIDEVAYLYNRSVEIYQENGFQINEVKGKERNNSKRNHASMTDKKLKPVWYTVKDNKLYISLGMNGQVNYNKKFKDYLPGKEYLPCPSVNKDKKQLACETCDVFGAVNGQYKTAGKVRFSDARMINIPDMIYANNGNPLMLQELASPKYSNPYFYLFNPEGGNRQYLDDNLTIRGRKRYWHFDPKDFSKCTTNEMTERNITVRPVKTGLQYEFDVYFNDLTEEQLNHLITALSLGIDYQYDGGVTTDYCHKLGMAKAFGFGSVKINVDKVMCKEVSYNNGFIYKDVPFNVEDLGYDEVFGSVLNEEQICAIDRMYDFNYMDKSSNITYPKNNNQSLGYEWFGANKTIKESDCQSLPFASEEYDDLLMQGYDLFKNNRR